MLVAVVRRMWHSPPYEGGPLNALSWLGAYATPVLLWLALAAQLWTLAVGLLVVTAFFVSHLVRQYARQHVRQRWPRVP